VLLVPLLVPSYVLALLVETITSKAIELFVISVS
jgi:hypothetical protein